MAAVPMCIGPMARDVDSLVLTMKAIWCDEHFQLDPNVPPLYFNEKSFSSVAPLRIGYYEEDGFFQPNPSMRRILLETKKLLEAAGHQLIPFSPPRVDFVYNLFVKTLFGDGGKPLEHKFDNNIVDPNLRENYRLCKMSAVVKQLIAFCLRPIFPRISKVVHSSVGARSLMDSWADQTALQDYQAEFISEWRKLGLDVVLCPMLGPAFNKGYAARLLATISYTMLYNVLQFPAGVVPVGSVTRDDEEELKNYRGYDNDPWDWLYREALSGGVGLPLSVQCVALPYQDELCLRLMKEVETLRR
ncbi:fatty-acid amide hydrolase 1-like isoform X3 [Hyla sarda]|nr:fatty-acid amide hydrolase 1-like isoform X3 [Hyla sarda]